MQQVTVKYKVLDPRAQAPAYATAGAAAADLCARRTSQTTMLPHDILQDLGELLGARGL